MGKNGLDHADEEVALEEQTEVDKRVLAGAAGRASEQVLLRLLVHERHRGADVGDDADEAVNILKYF